MNAQVSLTVINDENEIMTHRFDEAKDCYVGSSSDCDIQLPAVAGRNEVSQHHCVLQIDPPAVWLHLLNNKNPTFVNNLRMKTLPETPMIELRSGDEVRVGPFTILVEVDVDIEDSSTMILAGHAASDLNY